MARVTNRLNVGAPAYTGEPLLTLWLKEEEVLDEELLYRLLVEAALIKVGYPRPASWSLVDLFSVFSNVLTTAFRSLGSRSTNL